MYILVLFRGVYIYMYILFRLVDSIGWFVWYPCTYHIPGEQENGYMVEGGRRRRGGEVYLTA